MLNPVVAIMIIETRAAEPELKFQALALVPRI